MLEGAFHVITPALFVQNSECTGKLDSIESGSCTCLSQTSSTQTLLKNQFGNLEPYQTCTQSSSKDNVRVLKARSRVAFSGFRATCCTVCEDAVWTLAFVFNFEQQLSICFDLSLCVHTDGRTCRLINVPLCSTMHARCHCIVFKKRAALLLCLIV